MLEIELVRATRWECERNLRQTSPWSTRPALPRQRVAVIESSNVMIDIVANALVWSPTPKGSTTTSPG